MNRKQRRRAAMQVRTRRPSSAPRDAVSPALDVPAGAVANALAQALDCHRNGDLKAAEGFYRRVLAAQPDNPDALHLLGTIASQDGRHEVAASLIERAIALRPRDPTIHHSLGNLRNAQGRTDEAVAAYRGALAIKPDYVEALSNLGIALDAAGRPQEAVSAFRKALAIRPDHAEVHVNLGTALRRAGQFEEAIVAYRDAIAVRPGYADAHGNLGVAYVNLGRFEDAVAAFGAALELAPGTADIHSNLGNALFDIGRLEDSLARHDEALRLRPDYVEAHAHRALPLLALGRLAEGWRAYENRLRLPGARRPQLAVPVWDGGPLDGKTILVWAEQGIGDEILFASCLPDLMARAGHCVVECEPRLGSLFARSFPAATVFGKARDNAGWRGETPPIDVQVMLGSLMRHFRPGLGSFPDRQGYLVADRAAHDSFAQRLAALGPGLKVGISWRSMRGSRWHASYSALADWRDVLALPGVQFVNLQYDDAEQELAEIGRNFGIQVHEIAGLDLLDDVDGVAALVSALDLVIAPANTVAALCGALAVDVWLLARAPNWCMLGTDRHPWFPSATVFQRAPGMADWRTVLADVACQLEASVERHDNQPKLAAL